MDSSSSRTFFFECRNPGCSLRFPLNTEIYDGCYCPRCGMPLEKHDSVLPGQKPPALQNPKFELIGALDNIRSVYNVGAIFRTADGAGLSGLLLGGITPTPSEQPSLSKTALGAEKSIPWSYHPNLPHALEERKLAGYTILAIEAAPEAVSLQTYHLPQALTGPVVLVAGSEPSGVDPAILRLADQVLYIPMAGEKTSLNVSVAFGVAVYQLLWK